MKELFDTTLPSQNSQAGFTLVELMVSLSLFIIVVLALVGSLYTVNDASRKVQAMRTVMDNLNFSMEAMARTIRTGDHIVCGGEFENGGPNCRIQDPTTGDNKRLSVRSTLGELQVVEYQWAVGPNGNNLIQRRTQPIDGQTGAPIGIYSNWVAMTSPEINIEDFSFYVDGASPMDGVQPNVIIRMEGVATIPGGTSVPFAVQTYLSQRTPESI